MSEEKRLCRVCAKKEVDGNLLPIFGGQATTAQDIFNITSVQIIDFPNLPALICLRCFGDLSRAVIFRNKCRSSDKIFRESIINFEQATWSSELVTLTTTQQQNDDNSAEFKHENLITAIKDEPQEEPENFFFDDYPSMSLRPEVMMNESSTDVDDDDWNTSSIQNFELKAEKKEKSEKLFAEKELKSQYPCTKCSLVLSTSKTLKYHMAVKHGEGGQEYPCKICGKVLVLKNALTRHIARVHRESKKKRKSEGCHYCMKFFTTSLALRDHIKNKHEYDGIEFFCNVCQKSFFMKQKLAKHMRDSHLRKRKPKKKDLTKVESYPCTVCGKICQSKGSLHSHEKSHRKLTPDDYYYCDLCGNKFRDKCPLKVHIKKRHIQKIRYACNSCPGKSWATNHQLKRHIKIYHYNIRDFKCEWCMKEFADKSKLIAHIRIHTGEQPFCCSACGAKYTHETDYRRHLYVHTGEQRKYKCQSCRRAFDNKNDLLLHRTQCNHNYY